MPFPNSPLSPNLLSPQFTFHYLILLPLSSSFQLSEMLSSLISNLALTSVVDTSDNDDIQSVHPFLSQDLWKETFVQRPNLCSTATRRTASVLPKIKAPNFGYKTLASANAKNCWSPCAIRATTTALEWWVLSFCVISTQGVAQWTIYWLEKTVEGCKKTASV